ncbi:hypothetical protein NDI45_27510 [Leptolyngbya sp. GB1-A1]|uniref:hypothetical protein n=1 Tax=Leptolyngbya sp. GB1-A1 TaxID=2933908 RepID=UPI003298CFEA
MTIGKDCFQISFPPFRLFKQRQQLVDYLCDHQLQQVAGWNRHWYVRLTNCDGFVALWICGVAELGYERCKFSFCIAP